MKRICHTFLMITTLILLVSLWGCTPSEPPETTVPAESTAPTSLPPETTGQLCTALVPEIGNFSMTFGESKAIVSIQDGALSTVTLTAAGEVPFLVTTIPLAFHAELNIP